jgi:hypothetical protein
LLGPLQHDKDAPIRGITWLLQLRYLRCTPITPLLLLFGNGV